MKKQNNPETEKSILRHSKREFVQQSFGTHILAI
jgi:hypothetical protein